MKLLAISGSLRAASLNTSVLQAVQRLAPPDVGIELFEGIDRLPFFNSDLEAEQLPEQVAATLPVVQHVMQDAPFPAVLLSVPLHVDARAATNWDEAH